jgi:hypothetical protein
MPEVLGERPHAVPSPKYKRGRPFSTLPVKNDGGGPYGKTDLGPYHHVSARSRDRLSAHDKAAPVPSDRSGGFTNGDAREDPAARGCPAIHLDAAGEVGSGGEVGPRRSERPGTTDFDTQVPPLAESTGRGERHGEEKRPRRQAESSPGCASDTAAHNVAGGATANTALRLPKPSSE